jgi:hypothetical protein
MGKITHSTVCGSLLPDWPVQAECCITAASRAVHCLFTNIITATKIWLLALQLREIGNPLLPTNRG